MKSALVLIAPGFEEIEAVTIIDLLRRAEISVTTASIAEIEVSGSHQIRLHADTLIDQVGEIDYDVVLLPGGPGVANLIKSDKVITLVKRQANSNRLLGAICAAPTVLNAAGLLVNKSVTSFPSEEKVFADSDYNYNNVVVDGNIITSRAVGTAIEFSLKVIELLAGKEKAERVADKILFAF